VDFSFWEREELESALLDRIEQGEKSARSSSLLVDGKAKTEEPQQLGGYT
jgi:uncharacterized protein YhfF